MRLRPHRLSDEVFTALAAGGGGARAVRPLAAAQYSKHVLLVWGVMAEARATGHEQAAHACRGYELLAEVQERAPESVDAVLRHPSVGAWGERTLRALRSSTPQTGGVPAQLAALAAAAAVRSRHPCSIEVPVTDCRIVLPSLGQVVLPLGSPRGGTATMRSTSYVATVIAGRHQVLIPADTCQDAPGWRGLRQLSAETGRTEIRVLIDDLDPYRMPSVRTLGVRLAASEADRWQSVLCGAWELLVRHPGTTAEEIRALIRALTPLTSPLYGQVSASSREAFGCVALSAPRDSLTLAVTLAHEIQHAKLAALLDMITLTQPDDGQRYYAPWRDDPRPLSGVLQGAYAYLGVSGFWRWRRHHEDGDTAIRAHAEFTRWRDAAATTAASLLASGRLTDAGEAFVSGMARTLRAWADERVPTAALELARRNDEHHRARWRRRNGELRELRAD
jgi:uncharacterized protein